MSETITPLTERNLILLPEPGFLAPSARWAAWRHIYETHIKKGKVADEREVAGNLAKIWNYLGKNGETESIMIRNKVIDEYEYMLKGAEKAVGKDNIRLVQTSVLSVGAKIPDEPIFRELAHADIENGNNLNGQMRRQMKSIKLAHGFDDATSFCRDLFTAVEGGVFVSTNFTRFTDTSQYKQSILGEGGMVLVSGDKVLLSSAFEGDVRTGIELARLRSLGYTASYIPEVNPLRQPRIKRNFVQSHIDGHSNLVTGRNGQQVLLIGSSYLKQSSETYNTIKANTKKIGVAIEEVDDKELPLLPFNFVELPNGAVLYNPTGEFVNGKYQYSELDKKMIPLVGDRLILTGRIRYIPQQTKAGLRCVMNVASQDFVTHITTPTFSL